MVLARKRKEAFDNPKGKGKDGKGKKGKGKGKERPTCLSCECVLCRPGIIFCPLLHVICASGLVFVLNFLEIDDILILMSEGKKGKNKDKNDD